MGKYFKCKSNTCIKTDRVCTCDDCYFKLNLLIPYGCTSIEISKEEYLAYTL